MVTLFMIIETSKTEGRLVNVKRQGEGAEGGEVVRKEVGVVIKSNTGILVGLELSVSGLWWWIHNSA